MVLAELELLGVLDGVDALVVGDERRQDVEGGRLTGASTAGDNDVQPPDDARFEEPGGRRIHGAEPDQVLDGVGVGGELPDGEEGAADGERVDHRVDSGAIGETGVDHRGGLVDAATDLGDDLVDDAPEVIFVDELGLDRLDLAPALHVDAVGPVDHDLADVLFVEVAIDGAVAEDVVGDVLDELGPIGSREGRLLLLQRPLQLILNADAQVVLAHSPVVEERPELVDQVVVDLLPELVKDGIPPARAARRRADLMKALG